MTKMQKSKHEPSQKNMLSVNPPVELIKATPSPTAGESFDELAKRSVAQPLGAVEHDALLAARLRQVLHCLRLARPRWTLHAAPLDVVEGDGEDKEALLSEGRHHKPLVAAKVLVSVLKTALNHPEQLPQIFLQAKQTKLGDGGKQQFFCNPYPKHESL